MSETIEDVLKILRTLDNDLGDEVQRHKSAVAVIHNRQDAYLRKLSAMSAGVASDDFDIAAPILKLKGVASSEVRREVVREAMEDIAANAPRLRTGYLGVKNYDCFGDQRADGQYGYGPRHGYIVFSVGLTRDDTLNRDLTDREIQACLAVLNAAMHGSERVVTP